MPISHFTELVAFLDSLGIHAHKGSSQNFLVDENILKKILSAAEISAGDIVLEIGPGPGALTELLLGKDAIVYAVEKDRVLGGALSRLCGDQERLSVFVEDILEFSLDKLPPQCKVVSNLPYHLTSPILEFLLSSKERFISLTLMVQKEVAQRLCSPPGSKTYGSFSIFAQFHATVKYAFTVSRHCFFPQPKIESAVIVLKPKAHPSDIDPVEFFKLTRLAFGQRRKMLTSTLGKQYKKERITQALLTSKIPLQARPESLSLDDFIALYRLLFPFKDEKES